MNQAATRGARRARYRGLPKTRLDHTFMAVALDLLRLPCTGEAGTSGGDCAGLFRHVTRGHGTRPFRPGRSLEKAGARSLHGSLADVAALKSAAAQADATVHAAVDYSMTDEANAVELGAVAALAERAGAAHADKPLIYTSTGLVYGFDPAQDRSEDAELPAVSALPVKVTGERLATRAPGVAGIIFRAGLIYGRSRLLTGLIQAASATGAATYIGDGANTWTPVHVDDLARLYVAALERPAAGIYNATGEVPFTSAG